MKKSINNTKGFTLIEVMVVVVILGMLAGIVAMGVRRFLVQGRITAAKVQLKEFQKCLKFYKNEHGVYPRSLDKLTEKDKNGDRYLSKIPKDPWGKSYHYRNMGSSYEIVTYGADGREGGKGEDADIKITSD